MSLTVHIPVRTTSEANTHTHWRDRQKRAKAQKTATAFVVRASLNRNRMLESLRMLYPLRILLTRIGPRKLDSDNLAGSMKHVRDAIADVLEIDDGSEQLEWSYGQQSDGPGIYGVIAVFN